MHKMGVLNQPDFLRGAQHAELFYMVCVVMFNLALLVLRVKLAFDGKGSTWTSLYIPVAAALEAC